MTGVPGVPRILTAAEKVAKAAVAPFRAQYRVIRGREEPLEAAREAYARQAEGMAAGADAVASLETIEHTMEERAGGRLLGSEAEGALADIHSISDALGPGVSAAYLTAVAQFIRTGNFRDLDPTVAIVAAQIARERDRLWSRGRPLTEAEFNLIPNNKARSNAFLGVRVLSRRQVPGELSIPKLAFAHFETTTAICLIDVIVFNGPIPGTNEVNDKHKWAHELQHVLQYQRLGLIRFVREWLAGALGPRSEATCGTSYIEIDADIWACSIYPDAEPAYIPYCGWTLPQPALMPPRRNWPFRVPKLRFWR
ncbi:DUF4157 domain-containing protein [Sphingomonas alba]|uniref:DUF4157 domain-containing protein n=1 Tax=Sphingomonas alba TaxID=2908208 RepID=A0ABT0RN72_9SPHN|nr:DUF4157 domain-containing protein [Sphingomonas alba]MCL6684099.1 DUF4157 domain-containing protein [Sphingomonas alba]